jgi:DNA-binding NarL/FixJ family response regulator
MIKLVIVDDHAVVRQGMKSLLEAESDFQVLGEAGDGFEAIRLVEKLKPDVLLLDLMLDGLNGIEVTRQVSKISPRTKVVIFSVYGNEHYAMDAMRAGAKAYVLKESDLGELLQAIRQAIAGHRYLSSPLTDLVVDLYTESGKAAKADPYETLTAREREVLQLAAQGHTNSDIATQLRISRRTVEIHRSNMIRKLGLRVPHVKLAQYALQRGIVKPMPLMNLDTGFKG